MRLAAAALGATALCLAALARAGEPTIPEQYTAAVQRANQLGASLYAHDHAASVASDELVERHAVPADRRVRGWLTRVFEAGEAAGEPADSAQFLPEDAHQRVFAAVEPVHPEGNGREHHDRDLLRGQRGT